MNLYDVEKELITLYDLKNASWTKCYQLMKLVDQERLYAQANFHSFSEWLSAFKKKVGKNIRTLWRQKKAGSYYETYYNTKIKQGKTDLPTIDQITISPDNLTFIEKISESHPWMEDKLMNRAISHQITRRELKNTWYAVKAERAAKGEIITRKTRHDKAMISVSTEVKINAVKAILCLQGNVQWLFSGQKDQEVNGKYNVFANYEMGKQGSKLRVDALIAETVTSKAKELFFHAMIVLPKNAVFSFKNMYQIFLYVDYLWVILPSDPLYIAERKKDFPEGVGILSMNTEMIKKSIEVIRKAKKHTGKYKTETMTKILISFLKDA